VKRARDAGEERRSHLPWGRGVGASSRSIAPGEMVRIRCTGVEHHRRCPSTDHRDPFPRYYHLQQEKDDFDQSRAIAARTSDPFSIAARRAGDSNARVSIIDGRSVIVIDYVHCFFTFTESLRVHVERFPRRRPSGKGRMARGTWPRTRIASNGRACPDNERPNRAKPGVALALDRVSHSERTRDSSRLAT